VRVSFYNTHDNKDLAFVAFPSAALFNYHFLYPVQIALPFYTMAPFFLEIPQELLGLLPAYPIRRGNAADNDEHRP
jgi:hypothetical protein